MTRPQLEFPTRSASAVPWFCVGLMAVAAGLYQENSGALAFGATLIIGPCAALIFLRHSARGVVLRRSVAESAFEGEDVPVTLTLQNRSSQAISHAQVCEQFTPEIHTQKNVPFIGRLLPGESASQDYRGLCLLPRGQYQLRQAAIRTWDPLGWFEVRKWVTSSDILKVYPALHDLHLSEPVGTAVRSLLSDRTSRQVGPSQEFLSARPYRVGDAPRSIHWRLSAHVGRLIVRQDANPVSGDLCVVIDTHFAALIGWGRSSSLEYAVKIGVSVATKAIESGRRVMFVAGDTPEMQILPASGASSMSRILDLSTTIRGTDSVPDLPILLAQLPPNLAAGARILLTVSPYLFQLPRFESILDRLRRHHSITAIVFDDDSFDPMTSETSVIRNRRSTQDSFEYARSLQRRGIQATVVACGSHLESVFAQEAP